jgi:hypothetical protein
MMTETFHDARRSLRANPVFGFYVLAALVVAGIIGLITFDVLGPDMSHFGQPAHRTHDVAYGLLFTTLGLGLVAQLRRPSGNVAGMVMALVPSASLLLAGVLAGNVDAVFKSNPMRYAAAITAVAALVHPAGLASFRSFRVARVNRIALALAAVAAIPLVGFASTNIDLQRTVTDEHTFMGHYGFMAALSFTIIGVSVLASLRPDGWKLPARVAGLLAGGLGISSLLYPNAASSLDTLWALAAIAWAIAFVAATVLTGQPAEDSDSASQRRRDLHVEVPAPAAK